MPATLCLLRANRVPPCWEPRGGGESVAMRDTRVMTGYTSIATRDTVPNAPDYLGITPSKYRTTTISRIVPTPPLGP